MDFGEQDEYLTIRVNGGKHKNSEELTFEWTEDLRRKDCVRSAMKKFTGSSDGSSKAKIFNKDGVLLLEDDFRLIAPNDILYIAIRGEDFNYCAILDDYEMGRVLGVGGFGKVLLGKHRENKNAVAIKFQDVGDQLSSANLIQSIYKEGEALKALQHKNIVKIFHSFIEGKQFIMIMESAMGGELYQYLKKTGSCTEKVTRHIILQVVQAMLYCHSRGVIHRDLKLENVLFKSPPDPMDDDDLGAFVVKVIDFGIAGVASEKVDAGTLSYMAPECLEKHMAETTPSIDVWAIGIMFYAMIYGELPFQHQNERELIKMIKNDRVKFPSGVPVTNEGKETIKAMLNKDPTKRLQLIDFVQTNYAIMDIEDFDTLYEQAKEDCSSNKQKHEQEEEQKLQDKFMASLDLKAEEKASKMGNTRDNHSPARSSLQKKKRPKGKKD